MTDPLTDALVAQLNLERDAAGLTLPQLAEKVGVSGDTMARYLTRRERDIPAVILVKSSHALGMPFAKLLALAEERMARHTA